MRYLAVLLLGCVLGVGLGLVVLYYNPLLSSEAPLPEADDWMLDYALPGPGVYTHGDKISYPRVPDDIAELWEDTIERIGVAALPLTGGEPPEARVAASRISVPSERTEFLTRGPLLTDYWLLTVPGEGSLLLEIDNELWPFFRDTLLPVRYLHRPWRGPSRYEPTRGPRADRAGRLSGASGRFRGATGSAIESYDLEDFGVGRAKFRAELSLHLDAPSNAPAGAP